VASALAAVGLIGALALGMAWWSHSTPVVVDDDVAGVPLDAGHASIGAAGPDADVAEPPAEPTTDAASEAVLPDPPLPAPEPRLQEDVIGSVLGAVVVVETPNGRGTAFFVSGDTLLTNVHVVGSNSTVTIRRASGAREPARVAELSRDFDVAVLKVARADARQTIIPLGSGGGARVGQDVYAIGSPLGSLQNTVTRGIVSAVRQAGGATLVQTDAAVNPGNSGGPLINREGAAIGITTMGYRDAQGLNFAVAVEHARALLDGRPQPAAAAASGPVGLASLSPAVPSDADRTRQEGTGAYERALAQIGRRADALDAAWTRFRATCYDSGRLIGSFDREWLASLDAGAMPDPIRPDCGGWMTEIQREAGTIRAAVAAAEEDARRADVYPGVRRDALQKRRLQVQ
jgi:S1-C subfamily serine protease